MLWLEQLLLELKLINKLYQENWTIVDIDKLSNHNYTVARTERFTGLIHYWQNRITVGSYTYNIHNSRLIDHLFRREIRKKERLQNIKLLEEIENI